MFPSDREALYLADPDPRESRRTKIARRFTIGAGFVLLMVVLIGVLYTVLLMRETQLDVKAAVDETKHAAQDARRSAEAAKETADRVEDCTEPSGRCFAESQERTGAVVQAIIDEVVTTRKAATYAAACAADPTLEPLTKRERIDAIEMCVNAALIADRRGGP